jgi:hypothetical protein
MEEANPKTAPAIGVCGCQPNRSIDPRSSRKRYRNQYVSICDRISEDKGVESKATQEVNGRKSRGF